MRIRATVAAVSGALALSALAVPAAQADDSAASSARTSRRSARQALAASGSGLAAAERQAVRPERLLLHVKIDNGESSRRHHQPRSRATVTYTLTHGADVNITAADFFADLEHYRGASFDDAGQLLRRQRRGHAPRLSATIANCKATIDIDPGIAADQHGRRDWRAAAFATAFNGQDPGRRDLRHTRSAYKDQSGLGSTLLQRYSKLTVNASPEPVKKGKTITVTGKLSRANWDDNKYHGYTDQPVKLQFRKKSTTTYTTVKTIKTNSTGDAEDHRQGHRGRLLPLLLRGHHDHPGGQRHGRLRRREVATPSC